MPNLHPYSVAPRLCVRALATLAILAGVLALAAPRAAAAGPTYLVPSGDTYLSSQSPRHNFGHAKRLRVDGSPSQRALLRFNAMGVDRAAVGRALLYIYPLSSSRTGLVVRRGSPRYWHETRVRYADRLAPGAPIARTGRLQARHWKAVDVSALLDGRPVVQLTLTTSGGQVVVLSSRESRATAPRLVLEPPTRPAGAGSFGTPTPEMPCGVSSSTPPWQHVVWVVMENKQFSQIGSATTPYINSLATRCGLATNFFAESHPSLPNYIAMTTGGVQGIKDDSGPGSHPLSVPSIFSQLGSNWRSLAESMPDNCHHSDTGLYAVRHVPAVYFTNIAAQCSSQVVPLADPPDLSAKFTFITPNLCNDMHSCPGNGGASSELKSGDNWVAQWMPKLLNTPEYRAGTTAIFLTWDEDDYSGTNQVATAVISPSTPAGLQVATRFDHYSLLRTTEEMLGLPTDLGQAATAPSMRSGFHL